MKLQVCLVFFIFANNIFESQQVLECTGKTQIRKFTLVAEYHDVMGPQCGKCPIVIADCFLLDCMSDTGGEVTNIAINKQFPGPMIEVCEGDTVVVKVTNHLKGTSATVHFHGQEMLGTPYEDGVPFVTQCPIQDGNTWTYRFAANNFGTHLYSSHSGLQLPNGFVGPLIVRKRRDPSKKYYDEDKHVLMLIDFLPDLAEEHLPGVINVDNRGQLPNVLLINGRGATENVNTPLEVVTVEKGKKYRIRIIHGGSLECPLKLQIEEHTMTVIATDGFPVKPVEGVDTLILTPGERYDIVLNADQVPRAYKIQLNAMAACEALNIFQLALLCYSGEPCDNPPNFINVPMPEEKVMNPLGAKCGPNDNGVCVYQLEALEECRKCGRGVKHVKKFTLNFNLHDYSVGDLYGSSNRLKHLPYFIPVDGDANTYFIRAGQINKISNVMPPFPLISNIEKLGHLMRKNSIYRCKKDRSVHQNCLHMLHVDVGDTVDMILVHDETNQDKKSFPMELHGHKFCVLYQGSSMDDALKSKVKANNVMKDTIAVPGSGIARIRFVANNPGFWLLHSQFIYYDITGMSLILAVGEQKDFPEIPFKFPTCGNFENLCQGGSCDSSSSSESSGSDSSSYDYYQI